MRPAVSPATSGRTEPVAAEAGPALWRQTWHDLAFLHWRVEPSQLRPLVPEPLAIDTFDGSAWVAVTPFWMSGVTHSIHQISASESPTVKFSMALARLPAAGRQRAAPIFESFET